MQQNVGSSDSFIRFLVGIAFLTNIIILEPDVITTVVLLVLGVISLFTSWTHSCMLYTLMKKCPGCSCEAEQK